MTNIKKTINNFIINNKNENNNKRNVSTNNNVLFKNINTNKNKTKNKNINNKNKNKNKNKSKNNNNKNSTHIVKKKKVKTIRDLVLESSKLYNYNTYISYQVKKDCICNISFNKIASLCEAYSSWLDHQNGNISKSYHIGILGENSFNYLIIYLATMFNGDIAIPLDPNQTLETLIYLINHSDVNILFYDSKYQFDIRYIKSQCPKVEMCILIDGNENFDASIQCLDDLLDEYKGQKGRKISQPNDPALIIYTSGTAGKRKGVVLTNNNLIDKTFSLLYNKKRNSAIKEIMVNTLPLHHIFANDDFFYSLRFGHTICLRYKYSENAKLSDLVHDLQLYQPTLLRAVPYTVKNLLNYFYQIKIRNPEWTNDDLKNSIFGKNLDKILVGGSLLSTKVLREYQMLNISVGQVYALTETSGKGTISYFKMDKFSTIGLPAPSSYIRIVNEEIQIRSNAVFKEYYKDKERTKAAFTKDGWFHTGDLGYFDDDHYLCYTGRLKNIIVLSNGEKVSPEYIESFFENDFLIHEMIVYKEDNILCAEVYPNFQFAKCNNINNENIKEVLWSHIEITNKKLSFFEKIRKLSLRDIPFKKNNLFKVDRVYFMKELNKRKTREHNKNSVYFLPNNDTQWTIYKIICHTLEHNNISVDSNFFEFGLNTNNYINILNNIQYKFGISLSLKDILKHNSVLKLEKLINKHYHLKNNNNNNNNNNKDNNNDDDDNDSSNYSCSSSSNSNYSRNNNNSITTIKPINNINNLNRVINMNAFNTLNIKNIRSKINTFNSLNEKSHRNSLNILSTLNEKVSRNSMNVFNTLNKKSKKNNMNINYFNSMNRFDSMKRTNINNNLNINNSSSSSTSNSINHFIY
eukprot:jgi/Orpsp1_1/1187999/evm.model.d7180000061765.1